MSKTKTPEEITTGKKIFEILNSWVYNDLSVSGNQLMIIDAEDIIKIMEQIESLLKQERQSQKEANQFIKDIITEVFKDDPTEGWTIDDAKIALENIREYERFEERNKAKKVIDDCKATIEYVKSHVSGSGLSAEDECNESLELIEEWYKQQQ